MITLANYWMGRDTTWAHLLTTDIRRNAERTVELANTLLAQAEAAGVQLRRNPAGSLVASGWRPAPVNASTTGASKTSLHITGEAIDIFDATGKLDAWLLANPAVLRTLGLWQEHPDATPSWCHVQLRPPRSGNRVFRP